MVEFHELVFQEKDIIELYLKNEWYAYTNNKELLFEGIKNSLYVHAAYQNSVLIGLIRVVGDGNTIIYIQDILVDPEYQHQGIGTKLIKYILQKFSHVRQIVLITDDTEKQINFYTKMGFIKMVDSRINGFIFKK